MNTFRVSALAFLLGAGLFSFLGSAQAQEAMSPISEGADYVSALLEITDSQMMPEESGEHFIFTALLKNYSPDRQTYTLGVDFRATTASQTNRLYVSRAPQVYALEGNAEERIQFTIDSPAFLSGKYAVFIGANDEKGSVVGMAKVGEMNFSATDRAELSRCAFLGQSMTGNLKVKGSDTVKSSVTCQATWNGSATSTATMAVRLMDFRYAVPLEVGQIKTTLTKEGASVTVPLMKPLPAGFYQMEVATLDTMGRLIGAPVRAPIVIEGVGGKIVAISDTTVTEKEEKSVVPVSVLTEVYDESAYQLMLSLMSEGKVCAEPIALSLGATSTNEQKGEFIVTKECRYPVIMATLVDAFGKKLDQAVRAFGERVPVRAAAGVPAKNDTASSSMISWGLVLLFSLPILIVILYLARKRMNVTRMMPLFFALIASVVFFSETGQVQAANVGYYLNYHCWPDDPCPEATTIFVHYGVKDTFAPGEEIVVSQMLSSDDYPITPVTGGAFFTVNGTGGGGNLDGKTYQAQELRMGVFNEYRDVSLKAPTTPGNFTLSMGVTMSGYLNPRPKEVTLRVVNRSTCEAPGWGAPQATYDGWAGSAPAWCRAYTGGTCTSDTGGNSPSSNGGIVSCCDMEESVDNVAYVRDCQSGRPNARVTMTGIPGKKIGYDSHSFWGKMASLWEKVVSPVSASGPVVNIVPGQEVNLTWTSQSVRSCELTYPDGTKRDVPINYTNRPVPGITANGTLTISCVPSGGGSNVTDIVNVVVNGVPAPPTITGRASGVTNTPYTYTMTSTDPEGNTLRYGLDRDNNSTVDAFYPSTGYVNSGTGQNVQFTWSTPGTYTFQAMAQDSNGASSNFTAKTVTITNPIPAALNICPTSATINEGGYTQLAAWYTPTGTTFNGCAAPNGTNQSGSASWSSSNSGVASVNATGRVSGVTPGSASIGATYSGVSDTTPTSVTVLCTPKDSCSSQSSQDKADLVCTTDTFTIPDGCGNNIVCNGARSCDYNWKEVAP